MTNPTRKIGLALKAARQLAPEQLRAYAWYQLRLRSGSYRLNPQQASAWMDGSGAVRLNLPLLALPERDQLMACLEPLAQGLFEEAEQILRGQVRLFGAGPAPLELEPGKPLQHWSQAEHSLGPGEDIKLLWEPARFGWAICLGRAYYLSGDERYPAFFWDRLEQFLSANPPYLGPNWSSAQEAALRLISLGFAASIFKDSPQTTPERRERLAKAVVEHAARIPLTLAYARAQHNNHLLSEAAGLITAARLLPGHPSAPEWRAQGWRWFEHGLLTQIDPDGSYAQHSANYQRLVLQLALWLWAIDPLAGSPSGFSEAARQRLAAATRWLLALIDPHSGQAPNLGPNDGAYLLPLTSLPQSDYRPVLTAAAAVFLDDHPFGEGVWEEMELWVKGKGSKDDGNASPNPLSPTPLTLSTPDRSSWAYLRAARFTSRPGHADQLHLDLWWRGLNVAQDAGTYRYTAQPPWENALTSAFVHNTVTLDGQDQMTRAGKFLYLDWAQAEALEHERSKDEIWERVIAQHGGYRRLGVRHRREVVRRGENWEVYDRLLPARRTLLRRKHQARLHWLLPDWPWELDANQLRLHSPRGWITVAVEVEPSAKTRVQVVRAGTLLHGEGSFSPTWGWSSPTYSALRPALSFAVLVRAPVPLTMVTRWNFPTEAGAG